MRVLKTSVLSFSVVSLIAWVVHQRKKWDSMISSLTEVILLNLSGSETTQTQKQLWSDLPPVVQRYFRRTFLLQDSEGTVVTLANTQTIKSLVFLQTGTFKMNESWTPFTATQTVGSVPTNIGFVWEASFRMGPEWLPALLSPSIRVCDAWVNGEGRLQASLAGALTIASIPSKKKNDTEAIKYINQGERTRWLAEALMVPTVLLPEAGLVTWKEVPQDDSSAILSWKDPYTGAQDELKVTFLDDSDTIEVRGERAKAEGTKFSMGLFYGRMSQFRVLDGRIRVPEKMEAGWEDKETGIVDFYFNSMNFDFLPIWSLSDQAKKVQ